jgi:hypothetical protein
MFGYINKRKGESLFYTTNNSLCSFYPLKYSPEQSKLVQCIPNCNLSFLFLSTQVEFEAQIIHVDNSLKTDVKIMYNIFILFVCKYHKLLSNKENNMEKYIINIL